MDASLYRGVPVLTQHTNNPAKDHIMTTSTNPFAQPAASTAADALDFLMGSGTSAKFPKVGHSYTGTVQSFSLQQQRDYDTGAPLTWDDGSPKMQMVVELATDARGTFDSEGNPQDVSNDDGARMLYVKANLQRAIKQAVRASGSKFEAGGLLTVTRIKDAAKSNPRFKAPYDFEASYTPASQNARAAGNFLDEGQDTDDKSDRPF